MYCQYVLQHESAKSKILFQLNCIELSTYLSVISV